MNISIILHIIASLRPVFGVPLAPGVVVAGPLHDADDAAVHRIGDILWFMFLWGISLYIFKSCASLYRGGSCGSGCDGRLGFGLGALSWGGGR